MDESPPRLDNVRYEMLPFGSAETEAAAVGHPLTLTVTCSPKHGLDHTVRAAAGLRALGHRVIVHVAARMVHSADHLDSVLAEMAQAGIGDVFLVGGDPATPLGPFDSAVQLLGPLRAHRLAPRTIGVAAYPEGHPLISEATLTAALLAKAQQADYMTTQLCFDPRTVRRWLVRTRDAGVALPVYVGIPGIVDNRRLLEVSMRVGVGTSLSFLRKQRGIRRLLGRRQDAASTLYRATAPMVGGELGVAGVHFYTFNRLTATVAFTEREAAALRSRSGGDPSPSTTSGSPMIEQELTT